MEYVALIAGHVTITPEGGELATALVGHSFVVEPILEAIWRIEVDWRKHLDFRFK